MPTVAKVSPVSSGGNSFLIAMPLPLAEIRVHAPTRCVRMKAVVKQAELSRK